MDLRENLDDSLEEVVRAAVGGLLKNVWTSMPSRITEDTKHGHVARAQPTIKMAVTDPETGVTKYEDHPDHVDVPIHHMGGGGVSKTFPNKKDDTGLIIYAARAIDAWFQSDGTQHPMEDRVHSIEDGTFLSGIRSMPRMLQQVAKDSSQNRSDDAHHVVDLHPQNGHHVKSVDPSTPVASPSFNPFTDAVKFFAHLIHPTTGHAHKAVDGAITHLLGLTHEAGHVMAVVNGLHKVLSHPAQGLAMLAGVGVPGTGSAAGLLEKIAGGSGLSGIVGGSLPSVLGSLSGAGLGSLADLTGSAEAVVGAVGGGSLAGAASALAGGGAGAIPSIAAGALHSVLTHPTDGASMNALNKLHQVLAHPSLGSLLSAASGDHTVQAHPDGVHVQSSKAVAIKSAGPLSLSAPPGMLDLGIGSILSAALGAGAASDNVGALGGDLSGSLPNPQVIGLTHVRGLNTLPVAANDGAAASAGVAVGAFYFNNSAVPGVKLLTARFV